MNQANFKLLDYLTSSSSHSL